MKLKILHVIHTVSLSSGGPVEGLRQLSTVNQRDGHHIEVVSLDPPDAACLNDLDFPIHAMGKTQGGYGFSPQFYRWMLANSARFDFIVVNGIWGFNALGTWLAWRKTKVPYAVFTHGMLDPWFKFHYPIKHLKKWLYWPWGLYPVLRDADAVFFTCEQERLLARKSFWLYDCSEVVLKYGTAGVPDPAKDYRPAFLTKHPHLAGKRLFLFFGRVHPKKGPDILIKTIGKLRTLGEWHPAQMRLVMAGPADSEYAEKLKKLIRAKGLDDSVSWTGMLTGESKWGALQAAEVFVLPSHQENFGIAVAEALSLRTPVLISHPVNISPEIAADGAGLADDDTVAGCLRNLRKWLAMDSTQKTSMRTQARKTFLSRYTAEAAAKDMMKNIYLILAAKNLPPLTSPNLL